ncbi:MAG TPA: hypothetical protein VLB44_06625 [Kofleriaceae bacterium]|nr:hypothetical protein [Kofleriaceae bacterium]
MKAAILAVALLASGGCFRTKFQLQPPVPATPSATYDNHFHFNLINLIELSSPVNLQQACGGAPPAGIEEEVGVLGAIVNMVLGTYIPILSVHNATVYCTAGGAPMGGMPMGPAPMGPPPDGSQPPPPAP